MYFSTARPTEWAEGALNKRNAFYLNSVHDNLVFELQHASTES